MPELMANGIAIDDTFAEAFDMRATAIVITAPTERWAAQAADDDDGFRHFGDRLRLRGERREHFGRPNKPRMDGPACACSCSRSRPRSCRDNCKTASGNACSPAPVRPATRDWTSGEDKLKLGDAIRFFGDGWQIAKRLGARRYWRVPVMDGEFVCKSTTYLTKKAVGGGNLIVMGESPAKTLAATEAAVQAMRKVADVIMPFPGGIARSGSKVGSKYKGASASTNDLYCPTLKGAVDSALGPEIASVLEIVIDGLTSEAVAEAMRAGLAAIIEMGAERGALRVGAGNYGGKLGRHHYHLRDLLP